MSDRIKKIKIKQADGTMSGYYPIGADAQNIDFNNGFNLDNIVGSINPDESGNIATQLSKSIKYYDCVADMKADTTLNGGGAARTLGYYEPSDGGGAIYRIVKTSSDLTVALNNGLYAELNINGQINVKQFGAYGDGVHDDSQAIQNAVNIANKIYIPNGTYLLNSTINIDKEEAQLIYGDDKSTILKTTSNIAIFNYKNYNDKEIRNLKFEINSGSAIKASNDNTQFKFHIRNVSVETYTSDNIMIDIYNTHNLIIDKVSMTNNSTSNKPTAIKLDGVVNCIISNSRMSYYDKGIYITISNKFTDEGIIISNNLLYQNTNQIISDNEHVLLYCNINNNILDFSQENAIYLKNTQMLKILNNYIASGKDTCKLIYIRQIVTTNTDMKIIGNSLNNYSSSMTAPFININDVGDKTLTDMEISGNTATNYLKFININETGNGIVSNNSTVTGLNGNVFIEGNSINNLNISDNLNGGNPIYLNYRKENRNIYPNYKDVKSEIILDSKGNFYKPDGSSGFKINITIVNSGTSSDDLLNIILSKDKVNSLILGNETIRPGYRTISIDVPAGYYFKVNTASSNLSITHANVIY